MRYSKDLSSIRKNILSSIQNTDSGHLGPSFSCTEILFLILKKYINWIFAIIVASIGVYNWCFIMFYRNEGNVRVNVWNVPRDNIKKRASSNPFFSFIELFTDIPLFFTDFFKKYIIDWIPDTIMSKIDDPISSE